MEKFSLWVVWVASFKATEQSSPKYFIWKQNNYLTNKYLWKQRIFSKELISKESMWTRMQDKKEQAKQERKKWRNTVTAWGLLLSLSVVSKSSIMSLSTANIEQRPIWPCNEYNDFLVLWESVNCGISLAFFSEEGRWRSVEMKVLLQLINSLVFFFNVRNIKADVLACFQHYTGCFAS